MSNTNYPPITLESAIEVTAKWRDTYAGYIGLEGTDRGNNESIFRGFTIPLSDIKNILDRFDAHNNETGGEIDSIRIYLAQGEVDGIPQTNDVKIHVLLVPATSAKVQTIATPDESPTTDILRDRSGKSLIYNFTSPCPELCDKNSDLYRLKK